MKCPYCGDEMASGCITGDGRMPFQWYPDSDMQKGFWDRITTMHEVLAKASIITKTKLRGYQCLACKKIIIDMEETASEVDRT
ncbi:MAG: hypothetical protein K0R46_1661 [Herbinix sp.]|nr:hypothetical protein [Herbinix sp.]